LGATRDVTTLDFPTLDRFVRERRAGTIKLPDASEFTIRATVTDRAIGADLEYLRAAFNHATRVVRPSGKRLLAVNPIAGYEILRNKNPRRPLATYDRYLAVLEHADAVEPQRLFGGFLGLVEALGWRVSAICALRWSDVDLTATGTAPQGRLFKRAATDKEGRSMWLPLSKSARASIDRVRAVNPGVGEMPLFPAPRARVDGPARQSVPAASSDDATVIALPTAANAVNSSKASELSETPKPWSRHHARKLLERAETKAGVGHQEGSDFHAYRRKWATEREHLRDVDVAAAGAWGDTRALKASYQATDEQTLLAVVSEATKLRDAGAVHDDAKLAEGA
jgi:integrase